MPFFGLKPGLTSSDYKKFDGDFAAAAAFVLLFFGCNSFLADRRAVEYEYCYTRFCFLLILLEITNVCTLSHSIIARHYGAHYRVDAGFISFFSSSSSSYLLEQKTGVSGLKSN